MGCCCYCLCPFLLICNIFLYWLIFPHTETYTKFVAVLMCATLATFRNDRSNKLNIFEIGSILITFPCLGLFFNFNDFNSVSLATLISTLSIGLIVARRVTIRISKDLEDALTPCEIKIFCQIIFAIFYSSLLCEFDSHKANTSCPSNISVRILQILFTGLPLVCGSVFLRPSGNSKVLYTTLSAGIISVYIRIFVQINNEPIKWLLKFLIKNETRVFLLEFWASLFILGLCFCYLSSIRIISLPQSVARKFFHLIAIPVFLSGLKNDPEFLFFLSACCLWVFIVLELIRLKDPSFLGPLIDYLFESLRNEFDQGLIVRTHIYLLTGFSASLWMAPSFHSMHLCTISGIVSIGIGDTMAAVIGTYIGKHKWPNSKKSLEGTMAAVISQFICTIFMAKYLSIPFDYYSLIILSVASSILEATLGSIDNLVLPLYFNILCILMGSPNPLRTFLFTSR